MPDVGLLLSLVFATFLLGGFIKGVIGVGMPTITMGLLSLGVVPAEAAGIVVLPVALTNVWQALSGPSLVALAKRFAFLLLAIAVGTFLAIGVLTGASTRIATGALGATLACYGAYALLAPRFSIPAGEERWLSPIAGGVTGLLNGATGVFIFPLAPYVGSLALDKEQMIQALAITGLACPLALTLALAFTGHLQANVAGLGLFALIPAFAGMYVGQRIRTRLDPELFRRVFFLGLLALGILMLARSLALL